MPEVWFLEELELTDELAYQKVKGPGADKFEDFAKELGVSRVELPAAVSKEIQGSIVVHSPSWQQFSKKQQKKQTQKSGQVTSLVIIRLGVEFNPALWIKDGRKWKYTSAFFRILMRGEKQSQPRVFSIFPQRIFEGERQKLNLELAPKLKLEKLELEIGKIGTELAIGEVAPSMVGFHGADERNPYWEIRTNGKSIEGIYNFWMAVEPPDDGAIELSILVDADLQSMAGCFAVGPKDKINHKRPWFPLR